MSACPLKENILIRSDCHSRPWLDWRTVRDTIDLAAVVARLLNGPALKHRGPRLDWRCPFHDDHDPSFQVDTAQRTWKCWPCDLGGDAATLVMNLNPGMTFPAAVAYLTGGPPPRGRPGRPARGPRSGPRPTPRPEPEGMDRNGVLTLVADAERRLGTSEGSDALAYLHGRGLTDETIRAARLGVAPPRALPGRPRGVVIPRLLGDRLALVTLCQPEGRQPKDREILRDPARLTIDPGPHVIQPGRPLILVEGEMDALLLGQELSDLVV
jgi:DNA primase